MDAVSAWSDCNRAIGHIFRVEDLDLDPSENEERYGNTIEVEINDTDLWFFQRNWDES